jgi:class 3 adenylate cyclase
LRAEGNVAHYPLVETPDVRYAKTSEGVHIAYQAVGHGPTDILLIGPGYSNIELIWTIRSFARFLQGLASISRLILLDPRGMGLSDPLLLERLPTLETRAADALSVMSAVGSERAVILGMDATGPLAAFFAASHPERTSALVLYGTFARGLNDADYPWAWSAAEWESHDREMEQRWGEPAYVESFVKWLSPSIDLDPEMIRKFTSYFRQAASPGTAVALNRLERETDVRDILPLVQVPTLVLHRRDDEVYFVDEGRYLADRIPGARFAELDGADHLPGDGDTDAVIGSIDGFLRSLRDEEAEFDRVLASVLFTDIVGSTEKASELGDRRWRELVERHHAAVRAMLTRYRGTEIDTAGDGFFATFDGPARAVRCACAIIDTVRQLGLEVRAGVHTGEVETIDGKVGGIAVSIGARVGALAGASEVLVSQTVKDLVAGSGLSFESRGEHELKGVPDRWRLYSVAC